MSSEETRIKQLYVEFMSRELHRIKNVEGVHIHPAPSMVSVYDTILRNMDSIEEADDGRIIISEDDLTCAMDFVARFTSKMASDGKTYDSLEICDCFVFTDEDLSKLQGEVI